MREIRVKAPTGQGVRVAELALGMGAREASVTREHAIKADEEREVVSVEASTPLASAIVEALMAAPFFAPGRFAVSVRQLRSIVSGEPIDELTKPLAEPSIDVRQDLWQFSHVTAGLVVRVVVASVLIASGMVAHKTLLTIGGLLFLPSLPPLMAAAMGVRQRDAALVRAGLVCELVTLALVFVTSLAVGAIVGPRGALEPLTPLWASALLSAAVGAAASMAIADDVGRREVIGLAASSQIVTAPAYLGLSLAPGFPPADSWVKAAASPILNGALVVASSLAAFAFLWRRRGESRRAALDPEARSA